MRLKEEGWSDLVNFDLVMVINEKVKSSNDIGSELPDEFCKMDSDISGTRKL